MYPISLFKYSNINAKLRGMYAKKLKEKDFEELMNQKDLKSAIFILKMKNPELNLLGENSKRIQIETELDKIIIADIIKIYRLLNEKDKKIFMMFIEKYKLKCMKSALRIICSENILHDVENNIKIWTSSIFKDIAGIQDAKDLKQFKEIIKETPYISIFDIIEDNNETKIKLFEIETELDKIYFKNLINIAKKENLTLEKMVKQKIDLTNLLYIYRIKKYYNLSNSKLESIIIPQGKIIANDIEKFINTENYLKLLEKLHYINKNQTEDEIEESFNHYWYKENKKIFRNKIFDIGSICAYINLVELENMDIIRIIEGIRYGISKEKLQKKLVIE